MMNEVPKSLLPTSHRTTSLVLCELRRADTDPHVLGPTYLNVNLNRGELFW